MRLLVIGGTKFLGRHVVEAAQAVGHSVTLANRGKTNAELFPEIEKLVVDRDADLSALEAGEWDAVIDTCGCVAAHVHSVAEVLRDRISHYTFVSSVSVYADVSAPGVDVDGPLATTDEPDAPQMTNENYGALKAICEQIEAFLLERDVAPWGELPVWLPSTSPMAGILAVNVQRSVDAGLTFRSVDEVVTATLEWDRTRRETPLRGPLSADKEREVLTAWRSR